MNKTLENELATARKGLADLQADLPQFHALLTDNEQDAQRLKVEKASLDAQSQARGRVQIAKEMLEQHQSDIAAAQAEVSRLEAVQARELTLQTMVTQAKTAEKHRAELDKAFSSAVAAIHKAATGIAKAWRSENEARLAFAEEAQKLVPHFRDLNGGYSFKAPEREQAQALVRELAARGAPIEAVSDGATGHFTYLDAYAERELPRDQLSVLIWEGVRLLNRSGPEAHNLRRLTPKQANLQAAIVQASSDDLYQL